MTKEKLAIHKQYLVISSPVPFRLIANYGIDTVTRPSGIWQLDCYRLLPEKFMQNNPVYNLELEYDETLIETGFKIEYYFTNINLGDSLKGVSGDLVELSEIQFNRLLNYIKKESFFSFDKVQDYSKKRFFSNLRFYYKGDLPPPVTTSGWESGGRFPMLNNQYIQGNILIKLDLFFKSSSNSSITSIDTKWVNLKIQNNLINKLYLYYSGGSGSIFDLYLELPNKNDYNNDIIQVESAYKTDTIKNMLNNPLGELLHVYHNSSSYVLVPEKSTVTIYQVDSN